MLAGVTFAALLDAAEDADRRRHAQVHRAWQVYRGDQPKPLRVRPGEPDDNIILNLAGLVVDAGVDALFGQDLGITVVDDEAGLATEWLNGLYDMAGGMLLWQSLATNGALAGHAALRILPQEEGRYPRLVVVDPEMLRIVWAPEDVGRVECYCLQWQAVDERGKPYGKRQVIAPDGATWMIIEQENHGSRWVTTGEVPWRYSWAPIVDTQNLPEPNAYYGRPDLTNDVLETQQAINRVMSNAARVQRIHGHPKVVAKGVGDGDLDVGPDEAIVLPDTDSDVSLLEPGAKVQDHLALFETVKAALHEISRVPEITAGRLDNIGQLSGLAMKILYGPLVRKTETKRRLYGRLVEETSRRVAELVGMGPEVLVNLEWPEIVPSDPLMEAAAAEALQRAGVSQDTTLAEMGYDPAHEAEQRAEQQVSLGEQLIRGFDAGQGA